MKNLYNTIEQNLKVGLCVGVKDLEYDTYCSILNYKDSDGNYRLSGWYSSIEKSKQWIGDLYGGSKEYWDNKDLEIVLEFVERWNKQDKEKNVAESAQRLKQLGL